MKDLQELAAPTAPLIDYHECAEVKEAYGRLLGLRTRLGELELAASGGKNRRDAAALRLEDCEIMRHVNRCTEDEVTKARSEFETFELAWKRAEAARRATLQDIEQMEAAVKRLEVDVVHAAARGLREAYKSAVLQLADALDRAQSANREVERLIELARIQFESGSEVRKGAGLDIALGLVDLAWYEFSVDGRIDHWRKELEEFCRAAG